MCKVNTNIMMYRDIAMLIQKYKQYGFNYVFKKFMNPNRTYKELDYFLMEFFYSVPQNPQIQSPSTYYVTGIDEIDLLIFNKLLREEAERKGFILHAEGGIIARPIDNGYYAQYIEYILNNGYKLIITPAGCDFGIEQYLRKKDETGE